MKALETLDMHIYIYQRFWSIYVSTDFHFKLKQNQEINFVFWLSQ